MASPAVLLPPHGGYRKLKSFQVAQLAYDVTVVFCDRFVDRRSRTHDQMIQAARSGVQNTAEGSLASGTSRKTEMKLTSVSRASLEELKLDYEDYLRQNGLQIWPRNHPALVELRRLRPTTLAEFRAWANEKPSGRSGRTGPAGPASSTAPCPPSPSSSSRVSSSSRFPPSSLSERVANGALLLIGVACYCLDRQLAALGREFEREGGFSERLYQVRSAARSGVRAPAAHTVST
jgi:four helix bundle suffix protein